jgi:putative transposase
LLRIPGGTFFFTLNLLDRRSDLLVKRIDAVRDAVRRVRTCAPFRLDAGVVLPDQMHCLSSLPEGDADFPGRWRASKIAFVKSLPACEPRSAVMTNRGERGIWQRRYWEHSIRDQRDFGRHFDYIHFNPVKHGLVGIRRIGRSRPFAAALPAEYIKSDDGRRLHHHLREPANYADLAAVFLSTSSATPVHHDGG